MFLRPAFLSVLAFITAVSAMSIEHGVSPIRMGTAVVKRGNTCPLNNGFHCGSAIGEGTLPSFR